MSVWQGDPPRPCLTKIAKGYYKWTPRDGITYAIDRSEVFPHCWYVTFPDGNYDDECTSLGEARDRVGRHYADRWGAP